MEGSGKPLNNTSVSERQKDRISHLDQPDHLGVEKTKIQHQMINLQLLEGTTKTHPPGPQLQMTDTTREVVVIQVHQEPRETQDQSDHRDLLDHPDHWDPLDPKVLLDQQEQQAQLEELDQQEQPAPLEKLDHQGHEVTQDKKGTQDPRDNVEMFNNSIKYFLKLLCRKRWPGR